MAGALQMATEAMFKAVDRKDADAVMELFSGDAQIVDEISRRWIRGRDDVADYLRQTMKVVDGIHTTVKDIHESILQDFGLITCWIDQDYTLKGVQTHVSAPTTIAFRPEDGHWKVLLFHSIPLPSES
jgi:uncharacterized protein (TIGR02246 family)